MWRGSCINNTSPQVLCKSVLCWLWEINPNHRVIVARVKNIGGHDSPVCYFEKHCLWRGSWNLWSKVRGKMERLINWWGGKDTKTQHKPEQLPVCEWWLTSDYAAVKHCVSTNAVQRSDEMILVQSLYARGKNKPTNPIKLDKRRLSRETERD